MHRLVEVNNLTKVFPGRGWIGAAKRKVTAVDRLSFEIDRNTVFGLVGESGCGKTSLVRAILYLDPPTGGEVRFDGTCLEGLSAAELRPFRRRMQIVFQDPNSALNPKMRIADSIAEGLINRNIPKAERAARIEKLLGLVGIPAAHGRRYPHEFSGGQKQRIVIARALAMEPEFLVLDEPVSNLDVSIQAQIINLLIDLKTQLSLTYLFISHDLNLVAYLSDRIGVMYRGRLVEIGAAEDILSQPRHPYTLKLFSAAPGRRPFRDQVAETPSAGAPGGAPAELPAGCPYSPSCHLAGEACSQAAPEWFEVRPGHRVACVRIGVEGSRVQVK
jgi:peptide/nickel transport system ATP-binding protein/oligopeptide transport system ATP-binding protein